MRTAYQKELWRYEVAYGFSFVRLQTDTKIHNKDIIVIFEGE